MSDLQFSLPLLVLAGAAILAMLAGIRPRAAGAWPLPPAFAAGACILAMGLLFAMRPSDGRRFAGFDGFALTDAFGVSAGIVIMIATLVTVILAGDYLKKLDSNHAEFHALLLFSALGMLVMVMSDNLVTIFLGLEIMSLSLYVLSAFVRERDGAVEAGTKYFLTGSFASGLFLMGIALLYGASGKLDVPSAAKVIGTSGLGAAGFVLLLSGFAFKLSLAPFHQWAPDVYEGAPTPITGFMSTAVKVAGFVAFFRLVANEGVHDFGQPALAWLSALTMLVGNVGALKQKSVKRMLAYSSVGHAGYLLLGPIAWAPGNAPSPAMEATLFYLVAYALTNLCAFGVVAFVETREGKGLGFEDLAGLRWRHPLLAVAMCVAMLSLAGIPPTAGFLAKFRLFGAVIERASQTGNSTYWMLTAVAIVTSLISLAYYLRIIVMMYMTEPGPEERRLPRFSPAHRAVVAMLALLVLWLGFGPSIFGMGAEGLFSFVRRAVAGMP